MEIKDVHSISTYIGDGWLYSGSRDMKFAAVGGTGNILVSPGQMEIAVDVTVIFEIKQSLGCQE